MRIISCHRGLLQELSAQEPKAAAAAARTFVTGLPELDELAPREAFARAAVHEVLARADDGVPRFFALLLARSAAGTRGGAGGAVVWSDPRHEVYPPALAAGGVPLERVILLRPRSPADEVWALTECLRCRGVAAVVGAPLALSRVQARRLQLAAERGGGVGVLMRPWGTRSTHYAAATRWLVGPEPGDRQVQRWRVQLIHGHGGRVGQNVVLEACRETELVRVRADPLRAVEVLGRRPPAPQKPKVSA